MTDRIRSLLKEHKEEIKNNYFERVIVECPPKFMQELLDVFYVANIYISKSIMKTYAEACCYLAEVYDSIKLSQLDWEDTNVLFYFDMNEFKTDFDELLHKLNNLGVELVKVEHNWNNKCSMTIRIWER